MQRALALLFAASLLPDIAPKRETVPLAGGSPVTVTVGPRRDLTVTIPGVAPESMRGILALFFSKGDAAAEKKLQKLFAQSPEVTLVLTTRR